MILDRRPYYLVGLLAGVGVLALCWFGPKETPQDLAMQDIRVVSGDPWQTIFASRTEIAANGEAIVYGSRPGGAEVVVQFVAASPYAAEYAVSSLAARGLSHQMAELLMIPVSWVRPEFQHYFAPDATHAGIAYWGGLAVITATAEQIKDDVDDQTPAAAVDG